MIYLEGDFNMSWDFDLYDPVTKEVLETEEKHEMLHLLEKEIIVGNNRQVFTNGVRIYVRSVFDALCDENVREILFYTL